MNTTIYKRDYSNFDRENFTLDLLDIEWDRVIPKEISNPSESFNLSFNKIDSLVNQYIPLRKLTKKEIKNKFKAWITSGIQNSMKRRDKIYKKLLRQSNLILKRNMSRNIKH